MRRSLSPRGIALSGLLAAVALLLMLLAGVTPSGWMGVTAVAGLAVAVAISAAGYSCGAGVYLAAGLLGLLLLPAKRVAVLFLALFGLYPVLKNLFERLPSRVLCVVCKLAFFNLDVLGLYFLASGLMGTLFTMELPVPTWLVLMLGGSVVFLLYDYAFSKVMALLQARLIPQLRRGVQGRTF
ncbi:MAG: hypothetical protein IJ751_08540 [Oscillospiraceae bacterium]|nr:hypothetical protein [Oscillospiraceae bacterium]